MASYDGRDLVRQWLHERGVHRQNRIEEMREPDAVSLCNEAERSAVAVEAPWTPNFDDFEAWFVVSVEDLVRHTAAGTAVHECECVAPVPSDADDCD